MPYANISASLSPTDIIDINTAFALIKSKLTFLIQLTEEENHTLYKMGPDAKSYVDKTKDLAVTQPAFVPVFMTAAEFDKDHKLNSDLAPFYQQALGLTKGIEETMRGLGHEQMMFMKAYYKNGQEGNEQGIPGADVVLAELGPFYDRPDRPAEPPVNP